MRIDRKPVAGYVLLINLASEQMLDGHLLVDEAMASLPSFDEGNFRMLVQGRWVQLSVLHLAVNPASGADELGGRGLELQILNMQNLFAYIIVFCSSERISREASWLAASPLHLRKPVIFVSNEVGTAVSDLTLALSTAGSRILDGNDTPEISVIICGEINEMN